MKQFFPILTMVGLCTERQTNNKNIEDLMGSLYMYNQFVVFHQCLESIGYIEKKILLRNVRFISIE